MLIVLRILSRCNTFNPFIIVYIPLDCFLHSYLKGMGWFPTQLGCYFGIVECISSVMAGSVFDMLDQVFRLAQHTDNQFDNFHIGFFVVPPNIVYPAVSSPMKNCINGSAMIINVNPVSYLHAVSIHRKFFFLNAIVYHKRNQFFRELVWAEIVAASAYVNRKSKSFIICSNDHVGTGFGR